MLPRLCCLAPSRKRCKACGKFLCLQQEYPHLQVLPVHPARALIIDIQIQGLKPQRALHSAGGWLGGLWELHRVQQVQNTLQESSNVSLPILS